MSEANAPVILTAALVPYALMPALLIRGCRLQIRWATILDIAARVRRRVRSTLSFAAAVSNLFRLIVVDVYLACILQSTAWIESAYRIAGLAHDFILVLAHPSS